MKTRPFLLLLMISWTAGSACGLSAEIPVVDKTLLVWAAPASLTQRGGSALTLEDSAGHFDAIVFGELAAGKWMAGSDLFQRTLRHQDAVPAETADATTLVQLAIVYRGPEVIVYRNAQEYSRHTISQPQPFLDDAMVLMGPRHRGKNEFFTGEIDDARIYSFALTPEQLSSLQPNVEGPYKSWAWWPFEESAAEVTGRLPHTGLSNGAEVRGGRLILSQAGAGLISVRNRRQSDPDGKVLSFHLMHPGGDSLPGDPNAAFCLDGTYHLHYILAHLWKGRTSFSFVHVTSPDMLHWTWQTTKLQPSFTGHGMFSGTGFLTKDQRPAAIYHGESSGRNQIAIATDNQLSGWEKPYPVDVRNPDGSEVEMRHWDPDCFLIGDHYYAISGGENPPLLKSRDLKHWTRVGDFLRHDLPDVAFGEDVSCANFFPIEGKWMLLCISHPLGCRYYIGDWDARAEQFVPEKHGRLNWRRDDQSFFGMPPWRVDFFAPESVLTPDGRRVMWAWLATIDTSDGTMSRATIQSLPRELSLAEDNTLRIRPLRELESLRRNAVTLENVEVRDLTREVMPQQVPTGQKIADLTSDAMELRIVIPRDQAERKLFGFTLFSDGNGGGLPVLFRPETGTIRMGSTEAPFSVAELPPGEDVELRLYIDRYLVELFVNDRQSLVATLPESAGLPNLSAFTVGAPTQIRSVELWDMEPTNQGFFEARRNRIWEPRTE